MPVLEPPRKLGLRNGRSMPGAAWSTSACAASSPSSPPSCPPPAAAALTALSLRACSLVRLGAGCWVRNEWRLDWMAEAGMACKALVPD